MLGTQRYTVRIVLKSGSELIIYISKDQRRKLKRRVGVEMLRLVDVNRNVYEVRDSEIAALIINRPIGIDEDSQIDESDSDLKDEGIEIDEEPKTRVQAKSEFVNEVEEQSEEDVDNSNRVVVNSEIQDSRRVKVTSTFIEPELSNDLSTDDVIKL